MRRNRTLRALAVNRGTCRGETSAVRFRSNPVDVSYRHLYRLAVGFKGGSSLVARLAIPTWGVGVWSAVLLQLDRHAR
jgi:hypothetical protein